MLFYVKAEKWKHHGNLLFTNFIIYGITLNNIEINVLQVVFCSVIGIFSRTPIGIAVT